MSREEQVKKILEESIAPYVHSHGGDVKFVDITEDGMVHIVLTGECAGCPAADLSTKDMIEDVIVGQVEGVTGIEIDQNTSSEMLDFVKKVLNHEITLD